jgi:hypothetical protein
MRKLFMSAGAAGLAFVLFTPVVRAATDFANTDLRPNTVGGAVANNGATAGDWALSGTKTGDGNSNRLGGAADPQVGVDGAFNIFSMGNGTNGGWIDYSYKDAPLGDVSGLVGSVTATFDSIFRARNMNNGTGRGTPILSLSLGNNQAGNTTGVGVSINVVNFPDDTYHYVLTNYANDSSFAALFDIGAFAVDATVDHQDANYEHAILTLTKNGATSHVTLNWNGSTIYDNDVVALGSVDARAHVGIGTAVQPLDANARGVVWFQDALLTASSVVPEPTSLALIGGFGLLALRRRRA